MSAAARFFAAALAVLLAPPAHALAPAERLDDFADPARWTAAASDQVSATLRKSDDGLCLDYDFHGVSGYASMRRPLALEYPADYEFALRVRGEAPKNALQFKLTDAANENVWWVDRGAFAPPRDWTPLRFRKREFSFAWGPIADHTLRRSEALEFTVYADEGGRGEICFADLEFRERAPPPVTTPRPIASATSSSAPASNAVDDDPASAWRSAKTAEAMLTLDFGYEREFGGIVLHWLPGQNARRYEIELSDDAKAWRTVRRVSTGNGGADPLYLPDSEARYLRIAMHGSKSGYALSGVEIEDLVFGASANAFFSVLAKTAPRGFYPRGFYDEQTYWTVVGVDGGHETGLFSEDGALEVARGGFSLAPFVVDGGGRVTSWADATTISHSLPSNYLPLPSVEWRTPAFALTTAAFAIGKRGASALIARYVVHNEKDTAQDLTLALVAQPFQVNPAVQFLNTPGGVSPIHDIAFDGGTLAVDGKPRVFALDTPDRALGSTFDAGFAVEHLADASAKTGKSRASFATHDDTGLASGALLYRLSLPAHGRATVALVMPLDGAGAPPAVARGAADAWVSARLEEAVASWKTALNRVSIQAPAAQPLADTLRTALADILINRDGPALRPGTRSYARSWIRDGAMMSDALLRLGHADVARDYFDWYAPYQFASGKVPCCVDRRGSDPVPENDSQGELIELAREIFRYSGDRDFLKAAWPHVDAAVRYMDTLRASERSQANRAQDRRAFYGLMPASISHEGYSAKPMHSYWDDFWALAGYKGAAEMAALLGKRADVERIARSRDEFRRDLHASIRRSVASHRIDYLPGSAELGDFDATSTTIALWPAGEEASLPQDLLRETFERYWQRFLARRDGAIAWKDYTPYEWRAVGAFVRLGWRERAQQAIDFFLRDRRPAGWNQWAEVVGRDPRESRFVGDMPHGWVASDFIRSTLDLFAYERESDASLVIAAGIPAEWIDGDGVAIRHLRTPYGKLGYTLKRDGETMRLRVAAEDMQLPEGGLVFRPPVPAGAATRVDGKRARWSGDELRIRSLPASVEISLRDVPKR
jgi:hypothetical protein